jgi:hypothetical protein
MTVIHKLELDILRAYTGVLLPEGTRFLSAQNQHENLVVWYLCDLSRSVVEHKFAVVLTGAPAPTDGHYVGTAQFRGGSFVVHVFVKTPDPGP